MLTSYLESRKSKAIEKLRNKAARKDPTYLTEAQAEADFIDELLAPNFPEVMMKHYMEQSK